LISADELIERTLDQLRSLRFRRDRDGRQSERTARAFA
jgi:hypothetical protein